jgi:hypothetical protein
VSEKPIDTRSSIEPRLRAEIIPSPMPSASHRIAAGSTMLSVTGSTRAKVSVTASLLTYE